MVLNFQFLTDSTNAKPSNFSLFYTEAEEESTITIPATSAKCRGGENSLDLLREEKSIEDNNDDDDDGNDSCCQCHCTVAADPASSTKCVQAGQEVEWQNSNYHNL